MEALEAAMDGGGEFRSERGWSESVYYGRERVPSTVRMGRTSACAMEWDGFAALLVFSPTVIRSHAGLVKRHLEVTKRG